MEDFGIESSTATLTAYAVLLCPSSFVKPLLYYYLFTAP